MPIPNVYFNTESVGTIPIATNILNRIAIVGKFNRGPANIPTYALGDNDVKSRYGLDNSSGSLAYSAARSQGAENFALVRVMGKEQPACSSLLFSGNISQDNVFNLGLITTEFVEVEAENKIALLKTVDRYYGYETGTFYFYVQSIEADGSVQLSYEFSPATERIDPNSIDWSNYNRFLLPFSTSAYYFTFDSQIKVLVDYNLNLNIAAGDVYKVAVSRTDWDLNVTKNQSTSSLVSLIQNVLSNSENFAEIKPTKLSDGVTICLSQELTNAALDGNKKLYLDFVPQFSESSFLVNNYPLYTDADNETQNEERKKYSFIDGNYSPRNAHLDFYTSDNVPLLRILALSSGAWGNKLSVSINYLSDNQFKLSVKDKTDLYANNSESFILNFKDLDESGYLNQLSNSKFIRGIYLPLFDKKDDNEVHTNKFPERYAISNSTESNIDSPEHSLHKGSNYLQNLYLRNGYDGSPPTELDYISAIDSLKSFPAHIILTDGYSSNAINNALISHVEDANDLEGLRIAVLATPKYFAPDATKDFITGIRNKRAVAVAGWATPAQGLKKGRFTVPGSAYYAGVLASIPFYVSPAARGIIEPIRNVNEVDIDRYSNQIALDMFADNSLEILAVDPAFNSYYFFTGNTLSDNPNWRQISSVRTFDYIRQYIYRLLQQFKSRPITAELMQQISISIDALLNTLLEAGQIANYRPTVVNNSNNNSNSYISRRVNIKVCVLELYAADYLTVSLIQDTSLSLGLIQEFN